MAAWKMLGDLVILVVAMVAATASQTAEASAAGDHALYKFCRRLAAPSSGSTPVSAYEAAMKQFISAGSVFRLRRLELAAAWRAVTYDEPCSERSLAYVHSIHVCQDGTDPKQTHLNVDVRKYAKKCLTADYIEKKARKYAGAQVERVLTDDLLAAYRAANPDEPPVRRLFDECCRPERATRVLAEAIRRDHSQEVRKFNAGGSTKSIDKFLTQHLYKPCASYARQVDQMMDKINSASDYAFDIRDLPQSVQDTVFRFKFCKNLAAQRQRAQFTGLMAGHF